MTLRQKEYIEFIEEYSGVPFTGNPESEEDISAYIKQFAQVAQVLHQASDEWGCKY